MRLEQVIDRSARRGLAALVQPEARHHAFEIRPPDTGHEAGIDGRRHDAGRRSHDVGEPLADIDLGAGAIAAADRADAAGMGIDQGCTDRGSRQQAEIARGILGQAAAERRAGRHDLATDPPKAIGRERLEPDPLEKGFTPAALAGDIGPFAGDGAGRARQRAGRAERQIVGKIEEVPGSLEGRGQMPFQPEDFRDLHLRRDGATDIAQHLVAGRVDEFGFVHRAVIHPDHDIARGIAGRADGERPACPVEHDQRTGRVEADAFDALGPNRSLLHRIAHRGDAGRPDVVGRLLDDIAGLVPDPDRVPRRTQQLPRLVEHARPGAGASDVHPDIGLPHSRSIFA
ncbi:hypothetical protein ACVWYP_007518 [Bradyrhizobium sp. USDA 3262]